VVSGTPTLLTNPVIQIGGQNAIVVFAGLTPGTAGLYQFNVTLPAGLPSGDQALTASIGGATSPTGVFVTMQ
jgi:uncharacterized protein (TIGR03437 family)